MLDQISDLVRVAFGIGLEPRDLNAWQISLRAALFYGAGLILVRLADKRLLGKNTAVDVILGVILGSVLSRGINGNGPVLATLIGGGVLVALHWILAALSFHSRPFGRLTKGEVRTLVRDGKILETEMRRNHISEGDLLEMLRLHGRLADPEDVGMACLERNGEISAIPIRREPRVVDVGVQDGVQTIRVELA
jgi:uncharacterized membrane protein YcaP (DUF421 family)